MKLELAKATDCFELAQAACKFLSEQKIVRTDEEVFADCFSSIIKKRVVLARNRKKIIGFSVCNVDMSIIGTILNVEFILGNKEAQEALYKDAFSYHKNSDIKNFRNWTGYLPEQKRGE